jgi:hypothetical protein
MAIQFIVEDGNGLSTATSYITVAELKQYWDNVGYDYSELSTNELQQKINKATSIIDSEYLHQWPGYRSTDTQTLEWPRYAAYYVDGYAIAETIIPVELKNAVSEMVYAMANGATLQPTITAPGVIEEQYVRVDVIQQRVKYSSTFLNPKDTVYAVQDALARITGGATGDFDISIMRI